MVRPTKFGTNYETLKDNKFMKESKDASVHYKALCEFNNFVAKLKEESIQVHDFDQCHEEATDSVFPNNWFSTHKGEFHPEGILVMYPMKSNLRRKEKNPEIIEMLKPKYKNFIDLSFLEEEGEFLESTGCLIFDNENRKIYCSISERATEKALDVFLENFNKFSKLPYTLVKFHAFDKHGHSIYHTNVMLSILDKHAVICSESITNIEERQRVLKELSENKHVIEVTYEEMNKFCCNILNLRSKDDKHIIAMSETAYINFSKTSKDILEGSYKIVYANLNTIEEVGGGSARCMLAEIHG